MIWMLLAAVIGGQDVGLAQPPIETLTPPTTEQGMDLDEARGFAERGLSDRIGHYNPSTAFLIDGQNNLKLMSVAFTRVWTGQGEARQPELLARVRARRGRRTVEVTVDERWCPQIVPAMERLEALPLLRVNVPYSETGDDWNPRIQIDGHSYRLVTQTRFEGSDVDYRTEFQSVEGSPISAAIIEAAVLLAPCWMERGTG